MARTGDIKMPHSCEDILFDLHAQHEFKLDEDDINMVSSLYHTDRFALDTLCQGLDLRASQFNDSPEQINLRKCDFVRSVRDELADKMVHLLNSQKDNVLRMLAEAPSSSGEASTTSGVTGSSKRNADEALSPTRPSSPVAKRRCTEVAPRPPSAESDQSLSTLSNGSLVTSNPFVEQCRHAGGANISMLTGSASAPRPHDPADPFSAPANKSAALGNSLSKADPPAARLQTTHNLLPRDTFLPFHERTQKHFQTCIANAPGIQYELYRISIEEWRKTPAKERSLYEGVQLADFPKLNLSSRTPHADFLRLAPTFLPPSIDRGALRDLDYEHAAALEGKGSSSDLAPTSESGCRFGRVHLKGDIAWNGKHFEVALQPLCRGTSTADRRHFGSHRYLELRCKRLDDKLTDSFYEWSKLLHYFIGLVWQAFDFTDNVLYLFAREPAAPSSSIGRLSPRFPQLASLRAFLDFDGPFVDNGHIKMQKRTARLALTRSATQPILRFEVENIERGAERLGVADVVADGAPDKGATEACMTDGHGFASYAVFRKVQERLGGQKVPNLPTTIQARVGTAIKGTWSLDPNSFPSDDSLHIKVRQSQVKLRQPVIPNPSHCVLNLVTVARATCPAAVNFQVISLLVEKGVDKRLFLRLLAAQLEEQFSDLMLWDLLKGETEDNLRRRLHRAFSKLGVMTGRLRREQGAAARASIGRKDDEDEEEDVEANVSYAYEGYSAEYASPAAACEAVARDPSSGQPKSLHETVLELLCAGFLPSPTWILAEKMEKIASAAIDAIARKFHYICPLSASAIIIPDPLGVLEEGEIFLAFSDPPTHPETREQINVLEGSLLALRHPCLLPSDIQKVKAVDHPELHRWKDVIIMPTKGKRSLASLLAGGDYDGDRVMVIFDPDIVSSFRPSTGSELANSLDVDKHADKCFDSSPETVDSFLRSVKNASTPEWESQMQDRLLKAITIPRKHGVYSNWHVISCFRHGASHEKSIRLAHITAQLLDAPKSGKRLKHSVERRDRSEWGEFDMPDFHNWMKAVGGEEGNPPPSKRQPPRDKHLDPHPLQWLKVKGKALLDTYLQKIHQQKSNSDGAVDKDVNAMLGAWNSARTQPMSPSKKHKSRQLRPRRTERAADTSSSTTSAPKNIAAVAAKFHNELTSANMESRALKHDTEGLLRRLKASYAYKIAHYKRFPWDVAFADLCEIKARAYPRGARSVIEPLYEALAPEKRMITRITDFAAQQ